MLRKEASCSRDTDRAVGTGGGVCDCHGLSLWCHFFFCTGSVLTSGALDSSPNSELEHGLGGWVCTSPFSVTTICCSGMGLDMLVDGEVDFHQTISMVTVVG